VSQMTFATTIHKTRYNNARCEQLLIVVYVEESRLDEGSCNLQGGKEESVQWLR